MKKLIGFAVYDDKVSYTAQQGLMIETVTIKKNQLEGETMNKFYLSLETRSQEIVKCIKNNL